MTNYNIPIFTLAVLTLLLYLYYRRTRLPIIATRVFTLFMWSAVITDIIELGLIKCFNHLESLPPVLVTIVQKLNLLSILTVSLFYFAYLYVQVHTVTRKSLHKDILMIIPACTGTIMILTFPTYVGTNSSGVHFNMGLSVHLAYIFIFMYMFGTIILALLRRRRLRREVLPAEIMGAMFWICLSIMQSLSPGDRTISAAILAMVTLLFIASENPRDFNVRGYENLMNRHSFERLLDENYRRKRSFTVLLLTLTDRKYMLFEDDRKSLKATLDRVAAMEINSTGRRIFLTNDRTICMIMSDREEAGRFIGALDQSRYDLIGASKYRIQLLDCPSFAQDRDTTLQIVDFLSTEYSSEQAEQVIVVNNKLTNRMLYEKSVEDILRRALRESKFEVYYQPIFSVRDNSYISAEALVRLKGISSMGFISPEVFIPIAERLDLVKDIDNIVFRDVCRFYKENNLDAKGVHYIEINLSGKEIMDTTTPERLAEHMQEFGISPGHINLEITETTYIENDITVTHNMEALKTAGLNFSMDDFGSGYSNLKGMLQMQFNMIKLDREFVWLCLKDEDPRNLKMLDLCVAFIQGYGMHVLAEGVESERQQRILAEHGVEYIQGFLHSKPMPEQAFLSFIEERNAKADRSERFTVVNGTN